MRTFGYGRAMARQERNSPQRLIVTAVICVLVGAMVGAMGAMALSRPPRPERATVDGAASTVVAGVPVGHPQSAAGAVSAAADYAQALAEQAGRSDAALLAAQQQTFTAAALARIGTRARTQARTLRAVAALERGQMLVRHAPVSVRLTAFTGERAEVALWSVDVAAVTGEPARAIWLTERLQLRWERDRWRIADATGASGPVPLAGQRQPSRAQVLVEQLRATRGIRHGG